MKKIADIFKEKDKTYSFEIFPPKTEKGYENLLATLSKLSDLKPDFISCTYGAGGGTRQKTFEIASHIQDQHHVTSVAHLTCVLHTKEEIKRILTDIQSRGIQNVLALRGDPPQENPHWQPSEENFKYSSELCHFIRLHFEDYFGIGVAGFPEGHLLCPDRELDAKYLKIKIDNGADYVLTQFFFNNDDYFQYVERLRKIGVTCPIIPGILPITNYQGLLRFTSVCGTTITDEVKKTFEPIQDDPEKTLAEGIQFAIRQSRELLEGGAPGLHFYTLNKSTPADIILKEVRQ